MSALSDLLAAANARPQLSSRQIATKATANGHPVGHAAVAKCLNGTHGDVTDATIRALHAVFPSVSVGDMREALGHPREVLVWDLPEEVSRLTTRQWLAVREVILAMVERPQEAGGTVTKFTPRAPRTPSATAKKAARKKTD